jgi:hypothetical protein
VGARFSSPIQMGLRAHPDSYARRTGYFPGVKQLGPIVDHTPPSSAEVNERVQVYVHSPSGLCGLLQDELHLYFALLLQ